MEKFREIVWERINGAFNARFSPLERERAESDEVLDYGSADFCEPYVHKSDSSGNLTVEDRALAYCHRYFRMHYDSSYAVFSQEVVNPEDWKDTLFIDFGCGPGTSGFAFADLVGGGNFRYVGVDRSPAMLKKTRKLMICCGIDYQALTGLPNKLHSANLVVFNFCFVLAHGTFRGDISKLSSAVKRIDDELGSKHTYIIYQNPHTSHSRIHENWRVLKREMGETFSIFSEGYRLVNYGRGNPVYCDILYRGGR